MQESGMATPLDMIDAHLRWMIAGAFAENTIDDARKVLRRVHRDLPCGLHGASGDEIAAWLARPGWSAQTVSTYYKHLVRFYRWAANPRDQWLSCDPTVGLHRPAVPRGVPRPAADPIVHACVTRPEMPWLLNCRLSAYGGLRPCEIARLHREHVTELTITILRGKGNKGRVLPNHPLIWEIVAPMGPGPLVTRPKGGRVNGDWVASETGVYLRSIGIGQTTLYNLRHWYGTNVQRHYRNIRVTQELMGHASVATTQGYTAVTDEQMRNAVYALPDLTGAGTPAVDPPAGFPRSDSVALPSPPRRAVNARSVGGYGPARRLLRRARP